MGDVGQGVVVGIEYEHHRKDGTLVSKGHVEVDENGAHTIQETQKGNVIDAVVDRLGRLRIFKRPA